jgi:hypothetical protein
MEGEHEDKVLMAGRVALLLGDEKRAREIIKSIENIFHPARRYYTSGYIASGLPDKPLAQIFIQKLEGIKHLDAAARIALRIGDKETIRRFMQEADQQESVLLKICPVLAEIALIHPVLAKELLKGIEEKMHWVEDYIVLYAGIMAAVLGERATARRAMDILLNKGSYGGYPIAAILGDLRIAEEMMWKNIETFRYLVGSSFVQTIARFNPEAAFYLMQALEKEGYDVGEIAAAILEHLDSAPPTSPGGNSPPLLSSGGTTSADESPGAAPASTSPTLQLQPLLFYEGARILTRYQRRYSTRFPQSARFIMYDLTLTNFQSREDNSHRVEQCYFYPDGAVEKTTSPDGHIEEWLSGGIGKSTGGHWPLGTYRVVIFIDGVEFAEGSFTVESGVVCLPDTRCERVVFAEKAYLAVVAETHEHIGTETGGDLLGHQVDGVWYVLESLDPGPNAILNRASFSYDHPYVKHVINKTARLYKHGLELLGFWHVHPAGTDTFSSADDAVNTTYASLREGGAISGIVNPDPQFRFTMYHVALPLHYTKVTVHVGDSLIPKDMFAVRSLTEFLKKE